FLRLALDRYLRGQPLHPSKWRRWWLLRGVGQLAGMGWNPAIDKRPPAGAEVQKLLSSARQTSGEAGRTIAEVERGHGTIGRLLKDPALADLVDQTVRNANQSAANLNQASSQLSATAAEFQKRDLLSRVQAMLENSRQLTETLNRAVTKLT